MNINSSYIYIIILITVVFFISASNIANSQSYNKENGNNNDQPYIKWVGQYPPDGKNDKKQVFNRLTDFVFGKKETGLSRPISILAVDTNRFWILDQGNNRILHIDKRNIEIPKCFSKKKINFSSLVGICAIPDNNYIFTDSRLNKIYKVSFDGKNLSDLNDSIQLSQPTGIAYSAVNNEIWVTETSAHRLSVFDGNGRFLRSLGKRGNKPGEFNFPTSIWIDSEGNIFVVDAMNFRVQIFDKNDNLISVFGENGNASGSFSRPKGIATDSYGNIYIADAMFHVIQVFNQEGNLLYRFGTQGRQKEQFWMPSGIYIDNNNYIYIADCYNSRVQIFKLMNGK